MPGISIVTTTANRSSSFALLEKWAARGLTYLAGEVQWLVLNSSDMTQPEADYTYNHGQEVIVREPGGLSIVTNWQAALPKIRHHQVLTFEDDDFYHLLYAMEMTAHLGRFDLVGVTNDYYYDVRFRRFSRRHNYDHASLGATAFSSRVIPHLTELLASQTDVWIDVRLWDTWPGSKKLIDNRAVDGRPLHVGLKSVRGAANLGLGAGRQGSMDGSGTILRQWIGNEQANDYLALGR